MKWERIVENRVIFAILVYNILNDICSIVVYNTIK